MATLSEILAYLGEELRLDEYEDSAYNGLQIEGASEVKKIGAAVDAGLSVVEKAVAQGIDFLVVHHGLFWGQATPVTGARKALLQRAFEGNISLYGVHLPLDAHRTLGNNFLLARRLGLEELGPAVFYRGSYIGCVGRNRKNIPLSEMASRLESLPGAEPNFLKLDYGPQIPARVCVVTGAGADQLYQFRDENFDTLITGEPRQFAYHFCKENKLNALFCGHYASETLGVEAVAKHVAEKFGLTWEFIDEPTGI
ncbi:MAG: Nif3-like dinuclear metal center hexameric protein [Bdellovibrionales bacterium]|nr:Nif3-like dinuclear metal center hexameric protein [Bdellovibrionales bacterium]